MARKVFKNKLAPQKEEPKRHTSNVTTNYCIFVNTYLQRPFYQQQ